MIITERETIMRGFSGTLQIKDNITYVKHINLYIIAYRSTNCFKIEKRLSMTTVKIRTHDYSDRKYRIDINLN